MNYDEYIVRVLEGKEDFDSYIKEANRTDSEHQLKGEEPPIETILYQRPEKGKYAGKYVVLFAGKCADAVQRINSEVDKKLRKYGGSVLMRLIRHPDREGLLL